MCIRDSYNPQRPGCLGARRSRPCVLPARQSVRAGSGGWPPLGSPDRRWTPPAAPLGSPSVGR
eukprot:2656229-Alexandrium_andersonii.AAC.1